jgi:hypothetical protein
MFVGVAYRPSNDSTSSVASSDENLNLELYTATVDANILSKFPKFIISAKTDEYDLSIIDTDFKKIKGVKEVISNFNNVDVNNIILISSVTYDSEYKEAILESINAFDYFESVDIYEYALLEVNQEIEFINQDDVNKTMDYYLPAKKYEGIVNKSSLVGDDLQVSAQALFNGEDLYRLTLIEMQNLNNSPQFTSAKKNYPIESWNDEIIVNTKTSFDNILDLNSILDYNLNSTSTVFGNLIYSLDDLNSVSDLNSELSFIKDQNESYILNFTLDDVYSEGEIVFNQNLTLDQYNEFTNLLNTNFDLDYSKIIKPLEKSVIINIYESDIDLNETQNVLENNSFEFGDVFKSVNIDVRDTNIDGILYDYDQNISTTQLKYPQNKNVTSLDFDVSIYATRTNIMFLMLNESVDDTDTILEE